MTEKQVEELIQKYAQGTASQEDMDALMNWYRSASIGEVHWPSNSPFEKQEVYNRMLKRLSKEVAARQVPVYRLPWFRIAAACLLIILAASTTVYLSQPVATSYVTIVNRAGKIQILRLPDNSSVWLNASSTLRYKKGFEKHREVQLQGEAFFEVTNDPKHPFTVKTNCLQTTVLGTAFDIKAYATENKTSVSVVRGKVQVSDQTKRLAVLTPSQQLQVDHGNLAAKTITIDTNYVLAWKHGKLQFEGQSLAEIAGALQRWYGVNIEIATPALCNCRYYMSFDTTLSMEKLLPLLTEITEGQYVYDKNKNTVILSGKGCR